MSKTVTIVSVEHKTNTWVYSAPRMHHKSGTEWDRVAVAEYTNWWHLPIPQKNSSKQEYQLWNQTKNKGHHYRC